MHKIRSSLHRHNRKLLVAIALVLIIFLVLFFMENKNIINLYDSKAPSEDETAQTTSTAPTAQDDFSAGNDRQPGNSINENDGSGEIVDNNGSIIAGTDTTDPIVSNTGQITLYTPKKNTIINSGVAVVGKSSLPTVSYRLIDSVSGVIAGGDLQVINGNFSGTLKFSTSATEGRLDIFAAHADGVEYSNIEIPLRLK